MDFLVKNNLLHFCQTAHRAKDSTVDQWFYLSQSIINCLQEKPHRKTVAVFLDLSAAFDRVWRQKLIHIIHNTRIACYTNDIAIWYTHRDTTTSQKAINVTLKNIAIWTKDLKLSINADKTTFCVFSTDRKHRGTFNLDIKINDSPIKRIDFPTNLSITLDPELRFTKYIVHTANKALKS
ncbi:hypothetical protein CEXT_647311 [Caerostris extrusa]|uniref:Reverse transcriptase domain-containing protein n=1 Tax=Caerostris extrusa TaxID=172846 RepID=A0AAV4NT32_CAEEX|nr:hypothetical protein CEXT_647311 [Caerostris extrusa]